MKKNTKKALATVAALSILASGSVFAAETVATDVNPEINAAETAVSASVNGATISSVNVIDVNGTLMFPLRSVAEGFGYDVEWIEEGQVINLSKGAQFITMAINEDAYAFSRQAHRPLGSAPVLVDDTTTHVPLNFLTEIIGGYYEINEDGSYKFVNPSIVTVKEVNDGNIIVEDSFHGDVIVKITEDTKITLNGEAATAEAIKAGETIAVEYSPEMTASIPPQTTAANIILTAEISEETETQAPAFGGIITEIDESSVTVNDPQDPNAVRLMITEETVITKGLDKRIYKIDDLEIGMTISGTMGETATMSIPPQCNAVTINIESDIAVDEQEAVKFNGVITEIEGELVTVNDPQDPNAVRLVVTDETVITKGLDKRIYKIDDLQVGMEISGTIGETATMSIPPQSVALTIEIK